MWTPDNPQHKLTHTWIVTNTSFTYEALKYSNCTGITLTSWDYPKTENLAHLIVKFNLYPVTALTSLTHHQKLLCIQEGFILAKDIECTVLNLSQISIRIFIMLFDLKIELTILT